MIRKLVNLKYKDGQRVAEHLSDFQEVSNEFSSIKLVAPFLHEFFLLLIAHIFSLPYSKFQIFFFSTHRLKTTYILFKRNKEMRKELDLSFSSPHHNNQTHKPQIANKPVATHKNWRFVFNLSLSPPSMAIINTPPTTQTQLHHSPSFKPQLQTQKTQTHQHKNLQIGDPKLPTQTYKHQKTQIQTQESLDRRPKSWK